MTETDWYFGVAVLLAGLALGFGVALMMRREAKAKARAAQPGSTAPKAKDVELEALRAREAQLLTQLRALADGESTADPESERRELEREAASVMRQIDVHTGATTAAATASKSAVSAPAQPSPRSTDNGMSDQWIGALKGGSFVAVAFLLYLGLQSYSQPRSEGMSITGNEMVNAPAPGGRQAAQPAPGESREDAAARALAPTPSPELDAARARVEANPNSREAVVDLGWALVDANGWIEVHRLAEALLTQDPDDPDGLTLAATVRLAMGQTEAAVTRLDKALEVQPGHARASYIKARLAESGPPPSAGQPPGHPPAHPPGEAPAHPPADAPAHPGATAGAAGAAAPGAGGSSAGTAGGPAGQITGTVRLAASTKAPPGAVLFIIARQPGVTQGPPVASAKIAASTFPATFSLGPANLMMGGEFPTAVSLSARLDVDGNAMTREAGDLVGSVPGKVAAGSQGVVIELSPAQP